MKFEILKKLDGYLGRVGFIETPHGVIETPAFVAVGTKATVKSLNPEQVRDAGAQVVLSNTYHLYLQPGDQIVKKAGGLGKFMNWHGPSTGADAYPVGPTMTDSGGFQVFSLGVAYGKEISKVVKITDPSLLIPERFDDSDAPRLAKIGADGVSFKSHLDGSIHYITPEKSIEIQHNLGADIIFAFDECTSPLEDRRYQEEALERTHRWAKKSLEKHHELESGKRQDLKGAQGLALRSPQSLFGIIQGGRDEELRRRSAKVLREMKTDDDKTWDGFGIGGSFEKADLHSAVRWVNEELPEDKPRHLLGIGEPEDLFMGIENGVDLFDCVLPTRLGRNGTLYTKHGKIHIENSKYREDFSPIEDDCECYTCTGGNSGSGGKRPDLKGAPARTTVRSGGQGPALESPNSNYYSRAYIAHLFHGKEMLAGTLASIHNLHFIVNLVKKIRQSIIDGNFHEYKEDFLSKYLSH